MDNWENIVAWGFKLVISTGIILAVRVLSQMKDSIQSLNTKMATIVERVSWHSNEIKKLDHRIQKIEDKI
jgi:methyl-accepting chemotaxis protein